jgi:hypothetical protein
MHPLLRRDRVQSILSASLDMATTADDSRVAGPRRLRPAPAVRRVVAERYELAEQLGAGGFGAVYGALDRISGANVAVKLVSVASSRDATRFRDEIATLRFLRLPGVVELLDEGIEPDGAAFLVMPIVRGRPFPGHRGARTWTELRALVAAMLETLARVHAAGIVHRDLKPANVLVGEGGEVTLLDFGASWTHDWNATRGPDGGSVGLAGTPLYYAPEQLLGRPGDARSDLYALGTMIVEALSGVHPHQSASPAEMLRLKSEPVALDLMELPPDFDASAAHFVARLLEPSAGRRHPSALDALREIGAPDVDAEVRAIVEAVSHGGRIDESARRAIFAGPDRLVHLQTDAAAALAMWAGDDADGAVACLAHWVRGGLASIRFGRVEMGRAAIERVTTRVSTPRVIGQRAVDDVPAHLRNLARWVAAAWPTSDRPTLARVTRLSVAELRHQLGELAHLGLIRQLPDGRCVACDDGSLLGELDSADVTAMHRALADALIPGTAGRVAHEFRAGDPMRIVDEVIAAAVQNMDDARPAEARAILSEGLRVIRRRNVEPELEAGLLREHALAALAEATTVAYAESLYELGRAAVRTKEVEQLEALLEAARLAETRDPGRALALTEQMGRLADPVLEQWRCAARARAANALPVDDHMAIVAALANEPHVSGHRERDAQLAAWWGRVYYRQGRYADAAESHLLAAEGFANPLMRMTNRLTAASAFMESNAPPKIESAALIAELVIEDAARLRVPGIEARGWWIRRSCAYRLAEPLAPDLDLVEAYVASDRPDMASVGILTEAAFAWREGDRESAIALAQLSGHLGRRAMQRPVVVFADAFEAMLRGPEDPIDADRLAVCVGALKAPLPAAMRAQLAAMLIRAGGDADVLGPQVARALGQCGDWPSQVRRELLSAGECLD